MMMKRIMKSEGGCHYSTKTVDNHKKLVNGNVHYNYILK